MVWLIGLTLSLLLGIIIAVYDIKSRSIPFILVSMQLCLIINYLFKLSVISGIIVGSMVILLGVLQLLKSWPIDVLYIVAVCGMLLTLNIQNRFTPPMVWVFAIAMIPVFIINRKDFPYLAILAPWLSVMALMSYL